MIIDLFSGYGGATQAWPREGVIKIDINPKVKPTIIADIRYLPLRPKLKPKLVHASPPCKYFSWARYGVHGYDCQGIAESLELVVACFHAFDYLEAQTWILENPLGFLSKLLNETRIEYEAHDYKHKRTCFYSNNRSLKRAFIPKHISESLKNFVS